MRGGKVQLDDQVEKRRAGQAQVEAESLHAVASGDHARKDGMGERGVGTARPTSYEILLGGMER